MKEIVTALLISLFNLFSGILVYKILIRKSDKIFYKYFFGSILFRYVINLFLLWVCFKLLNYEKLTFALSYLIGTFFAILIEIIYLNKKSIFLNL
jgi:hypothetical protein